jgi:hypothetical protein
METDLESGSTPREEWLGIGTSKFKKNLDNGAINLATTNA